jgi:hypothetical protein
MTPQRIRLSRAKGWRMPANTVKVDRSTKWGNPFVVGTHGTAEYCVYLYEMIAQGYFCLMIDNAEAQKAARAQMEKAKEELAGKNLACWCRHDKACHADVLLKIANEPSPDCPVNGLASEEE